MSRKHGSKKSMTVHNFYCISCGNRGIDLMRPQGFKHEKMHRKKLYCIHCKQEVNHIECKTFDEVEEFHHNFENGVYKNEAEESIRTCGSARLW